jgi:ubiquinone/menaquinone biosynthesis C-methylase UbiE
MIVKIPAKNRFHPTLLGLLFHPAFIGRYALYQEVRAFSKGVTGNILDLGCGDKPYSVLFRNSEYIGLDYENSAHESRNLSADIFYDGIKIPFENDYFDALLCTEVLTHVIDYSNIISEIHRVLKPGGTALITLPFLWFENEPPNDYYRFTSWGSKSLFTEGFKILYQRKILSVIPILVQLVLSMIYYRYCKRNYFLIVIFSIIVFPIKLLAFLIHLIDIKPNVFYFSNVLIVEKEV